MKIGIVLDLNNYKEYFNCFSAVLGETCKFVELHLISSDISSKDEFFSKIQNTSIFFRDAGVTGLGCHFLDSVVNNIIIYELFSSHLKYKRLLQNIDFDQSVRMLSLMLEGASIASNCLGVNVKAIIHEGIFFNTRQLKMFSRRELEELREIFLKNIGFINDKYFSKYKDSIAFCFENSPPYSGAGLSVQHFIDQIILDMTPRLKPRELIAFDVCHWFMCCEYLRKGNRGVVGLDIFRTTNNENDLLFDYYDILNKEKSKIGWIHLNDCSGIKSENEGLSLFQSDSIVKWELLLPILKLINAPMLLEILGSENDFAIIEQSYNNFKDLWYKVN